MIADVSRTVFGLILIYHNIFDSFTSLLFSTFLHIHNNLPLEEKWKENGARVYNEPESGLDISSFGLFSTLSSFEGEQKHTSPSFS